MEQLKIEKITLNIGTGKDQKRLERALKLLEKISENKPIKTVTQKRIAGWGLRPGLPIGCKVTLRKDEAKKILLKLLAAKDNILDEKNFDNNGNLAFGIKEYIDISGINYEPEIGMMGLQVCVTFEKPGYRIKKRKIQKKKIPEKNRISKEDAIEYMKKNFGIKLGDQE